MSLESTPVRLDLKKDEALEIEWQDGLRSVYPISMLRAMCPCAMCKELREHRRAAPPPAQPAARKTSLAVLPGNYSKPLVVVDAELVGGYALRLEWSDDHASGIYSFQYLREISPQKPKCF